MPKLPRRPRHPPLLRLCGAQARAAASGPSRSRWRVRRRAAVPAPQQQRSRSRMAPTAALRPAPTSAVAPPPGRAQREIFSPPVMRPASRRWGPPPVSAVDLGSK
ncbi:hypothetical protein VPH35_116571 [Triticum aestivum]